MTSATTTLTNDIQALRTALEAAVGDEKIDILHELSASYYRIDPTQSEHYAREALKLSKTQDDQARIGNSYQLLGTSFWSRGDYQQAIEYYQQALLILKEFGERRDVARCYGNLGIIYERWSEYEQALDYHLKALAIFEELNDETTMCVACNNIGLVFYYQENYERARQYHRKSLELARKLDKPHSIARSYNNLGLLYRRMGDFEEALDFHTRALDIQQEIGDLRGQAMSHQNIGETKQSQEKYAEATRFHTRARELFEQLEDKNGLCEIFCALGNLANHTGHPEEALTHFQHSIELAREIGAKSIELVCYEDMVKILEARGDFAAALDYAKKYIELREMVFNEEKTHHINRMQIIYETERREKEKEIYRLKNIELARVVARLQEVVREKTEILGIVSHDLKNPLASLNLFAELLSRPGQASKDILIYSDKIKDISQHMNDLVSTLLKAHRYELDGPDLSLAEINLRDVLHKLINLHKPIAARKNIRFHFSAEGTAFKIYADSDAVRQVLDNLLSNAIKFSPSDRHVFVRLIELETTVRCEIQDEGQGLAEDELAQLFGKFVRLSAKPTGGESSTGLGLSIVKKLVESMRGRVWADSPGKDQGCTFFVELPQEPPAQTD